MNENLKKQLEEIDKTSVIKRLKSLLDIKERNETKVKITQEFPQTSQAPNPHHARCPAPASPS